MQPPPATGVVLGCSIHHLNQDGAEEVANRHGAPEEWNRDRLERRRRLRVEELEQADVREHVGDAEDEVLDGQPQAADRQRLQHRDGVQHPVALRDLYSEL